MAEQRVNLSPIKWLGLVIIMIALANITVLLDIPVARLIFGFIFLAFIPGFLFLNILKLNKLGLVEKIVLSVGLSVAFSSLFGLALNGLLLAIGYTKPLSIISLLISFSTANIVLAIIAYMRNRDLTITFSSLKLTVREKAFLIVPAIFPLLSMAGMRIMNISDNNALLMVLLFLIPAYVIILSFSNRRVSEKVYPAAIFLISISLLLMYSLRSNHIIGSDVHREYFIFLTTIDNLKWSQLGFGLLDTCISNSLLPAIYQTFLNIDPEYLYKLFYSVMVSILPLVVYLLSKKYIGSFYAFLASVFLMSQISFLSTPSMTRTSIAILFFGLAVLVMFQDGISEFSKRTLFIVFTAAVVLSHYGTTFVTFFVLLLTWIGTGILLQIASRKKESAILSTGNYASKKKPLTSSSQGESSRVSNPMLHNAKIPGPFQTQPGKVVTFTLLLLFLVMLFFWHSQMTTTSFYAGVRFIYGSLTNWTWFLGEDIGGQPVQAAFGQIYAYTGVPHWIEFVFSWLTVIFLSTGLLTVILRFKTMISTPFTKPEKQPFLQKRFEAEYLMLSIGCFILVVTTVIIPYVSAWYGTARAYFQMVIPLSIFFVIGGIEIAKYLKVRPYWLILVVLIPYFLCTTGVVTQVFGFPRAITLNSEGPLYYMYVSDEESHAAKWLQEYSEKETTIYSKGFSSEVLLSQGKLTRRYMPGARVSELVEDKEIDGYIYLRPSDIANNELVTKYPNVFAEKSMIYANGKSQVYR